MVDNDEIKNMNKQKMVDLLNDDLRHEWKHMRFYLYHASAVEGLHCEEYKELFLKEAASEMMHVTEFSDLINGLGGTATAESHEFPKFTRPRDIIKYALEMEEEVIHNYFQRMYDAERLSGVDGRWLEIFLEDQMKHSRTDVDHFRKILRGLE